jgi:hypothetical protein
VILQVSIGDVASRTVEALRESPRESLRGAQDIALLPAAEIMDLAGLRSSLSPAPGYVTADSLANILHAAVHVDWDDLAVIISDTGTLPVSQRVRRAARREIFRHAAAERHATIVTPGIAKSAARDVVLDYNVSGTTARGATTAALALGLGANLFGGSLRADWLLLNRDHVTIAWDRVAPEATHLRDVRLGEIELGNIGVPVAGVALSSHAWWDDHDTPPIRLADAPGAGWEVEAYHDDALVYAGISDSTGRFALQLPAVRGTNTVTLREYGPHGEYRTINRYISIGRYALARGAAQYSVIFGRCMTRLCSDAAEFNVAFAPISGVTVVTDVDLFHRDDGIDAQPSGIIAIHARDALNVRALISRGFHGIESEYSPSSAFSLTTNYRMVTPTQSWSPHPSTARGSQTSIYASWTTAMRSSLFAGADFDGTKVAIDRSFRVGAAFSPGRSYLRPTVTVFHDVNSARRRVRVGGYAEVPVRLLLPAGSLIRGRVLDDASGESSATLSLPVVGAGTLELTATWSRMRRTPDLGLSFNLFAPVVTYTSRSTHYAGAPSVSQSITGAIAITRSRIAGSGPVRFSPTQLRGRGAIAGVVFIDANANGVYDAGEPTVPGVVISSGRAVSESDSAGVYRFSYLRPFEPTTLLVDSLTLPEPGMMVTPTRVVPAANGTTRVDLPIREAVSGALVRGLGDGDVIAEHTQRSDAPAVHRDDLQSGSGYAGPVTDTRQPAELRKNISAQC